MITKQITHSKNGNLTNLTGSVDVLGDSVQASISFKNNTNKRITAIRLIVLGYNGFKEPVLIDGSPSFTVLIQDLRVEPFSELRNHKFVLPDNQIRNIEIHEGQTCFEDGTVTTYKGGETVKYTLSCFDRNNKADAETIVSLSSFSTKINNYPTVVDADWVCYCGTYNSDDVCRNCKKTKKAVFDIFQPNSINKLIKKRKRNKILPVFIAIFGIIGAIFGAACVTHFNANCVFFSESALREEVEGRWTRYNDSYQMIIQLEIDGDTLVKTHRDGPSYGGTYDIEWMPFRGEFKSSEGYLYKLEKDGTISTDWETGSRFNYKRGGNDLIVTEDKEKDDYEFYMSVLNLTKGKLYTEGSYTKCDITVTNTGKKTYTDIYVFGTFKDANGKTLNLVSDILCRNKGLRPGESVTVTLEAICSGAVWSDIAVVTAETQE